MELSEAYINSVVRKALEEDLGKEGDITSCAVVLQQRQGLAEIVAREKGIVAGIHIAKRVFQELDEDMVFDNKVDDGELVEPSLSMVSLKGKARSILAAERTALNFLQHLSGIATLTYKYVKAIEGYSAKIRDTRKTTPGLRFLEKYAVRVGGGENHRLGLYDQVLIKDNHIKLAGSLSEAIRRAKQSLPQGTRIEVEVENKEELEEALTLGIDTVMLDNIAPQDIVEFVRINGGRVKLEVSGGVDLKTVKEIAETGVDYISIGRLTHSAPALDIALEFKKVDAEN